MRPLTTPLASLLLSACMLASGGCGSVQVKALATVNGEPVTNEEFDRFLRTKLGEISEEPLSDAVRSGLLDELLKRKVTVQAARAQGVRLEKTDVLVMAVEDEPIKAETTDELLVHKYYREIVLRDVEVTPEEVAHFYDQNRQNYSHANGFYVREIRVPTREEAERLRREIAAGRSDFATVARASSKAPTARTGGLAFYEKGQLPAVLERAVEPLSLGSMSPVVQSSFGYHFFLLEARGSDLPLDRVRGQIADELRLRKNEQLVEANSEQLLGRANIAIDSRLLRFQYGGRFAQ